MTTTEPQIPKRGWLSTPGAAEYLGKTVPWVRRNISRIPHYRMGKELSFREADLDAYIASTREGS